MSEPQFYVIILPQDASDKLRLLAESCGESSHSLIEFIVMEYIARVESDFPSALEPQKKYCPPCGKELPLSQFHRNPRGALGHNDLCKIHNRKRARDRYHNQHPERDVASGIEKGRIRGAHARFVVDDPVLFGKRLKEVRRELNISQVTLARMMGLHRYTIIGYENGKHLPSIETVDKLAEMLKVDADYLCSGTKT